MTDGVKTSPVPRLDLVVAGIALAAIAAYVVMWAAGLDTITFMGRHALDLPLYVAVIASVPLLWRVLKRFLRLEMTADLLAAISIVAAVLLDEYLAATIVVLMLSGGQALEALAVRRASFALENLAKRVPSIAHKRLDSSVVDIALEQVHIGDDLIVFPHEICPVDGTVIEGRSTMNEAYLTGEPYVLSKAVGSAVLAGAINGEGALVIKAEKRSVDSRYARIMEVMRDAEERRPKLRRLGDQIGAIYTLVILVFAVATWIGTGSADRFLSILVVATPCPLIIGIPVAVIGSVSLAARRGIIIKDPAILEKLDTCKVAIFDKTGTLTYGEPRLTDIVTAKGLKPEDVLQPVASLERYSRHPLASPILSAAESRGIKLVDPSEVSERPGEGLTGIVDGKAVQITSRSHLARQRPELAEKLPPQTGGLECVALIDGRYAATLRFRDAPREDGRSFITHLRPKHGFQRILLVSGDRLSEVEYLAKTVGITEVHAAQTPEQKLELVRKETSKGDTVFMGDGINDAPALTAATVGIAFGPGSDVTSEAAAAVILDNSLKKVDELLHIGRRMRTIALQSAVGGIALSLIGVGFAAAGLLPPVAGAITQEVIDILAILNAIRATWGPKVMSDAG
jgi:heavy metal translocating P-type ATPase